MDFLSDFAAVPAIVVIVYLFATGYKVWAGDNEKRKKLIPVLCGLLGGILGMLSFVFMCEYCPGDNLLTAVATGIVSGFSATGINQVYKQLAKNSNGSDA